MNLTSLRQTAGLLRAFDATSPVDENLETYRVALDGRDADSIEVDLYRPPSDDPAAPAVMINHGLSMTANRDVRFIRFARAFAEQGFRVLAPRYPTLVRLEITPHTLEEMVGLFNALAAGGPLLARGRPIGLFAISFSAGLGTLAANDPRVELPISAMFNLGGYSDLGRTLQGLLTPPDPEHPRDDYGRLVYLFNQFDRVLPEASPSLRDWLLQAIRDNVSGDSTPNRLLAESLSGTDRFWQPKVADPGDPDVLARATRVAVLAAASDWNTRLSPLFARQRLKIPTWLMHGRGDRVILPEESRRLERRLRREGTNVQALYTDGIGHAGAGRVSRLRTVWEQLRMVFFTAGWLRMVQVSDAAARGRLSRTAAVTAASASPIGDTGNGVGRWADGQRSRERSGPERSGAPRRS